MPDDLRPGIACESWLRAVAGPLCASLAEWALHAVRASQYRVGMSSRDKVSVALDAETVARA
ncbi:MAG: hypothetical protein JWQ48_1702 [Conexibacter sp.]|nr:hypothetical protein [Conexibacter sp.]